MSGLHRRVSVCLMISVHSRCSLDVAMALDPHSQHLGVFGRLSPLYMDWMVFVMRGIGWTQHCACRLSVLIQPPRRSNEDSESSQESK